MAIEVDISKALGALDSLKDMVGEASVEYLEKVGEDMYHTALSTKTYTDRTHYLSSTIGYGVFDNGELVYTGGFSGEGKTAGVEMLHSLASEVGTDPTVVLVAAAPYAAITERSGFVVLDGARLAASAIVQRHKPDFTP